MEICLGVFSIWTMGAGGGGGPYMDHGGIPYMDQWGDSLYGPWRISYMDHWGHSLYGLVGVFPQWGYMDQSMYAWRFLHPFLNIFLTPFWPQSDFLTPFFVGIRFWPPIFRVLAFFTFLVPFLPSQQASLPKLGWVTPPPLPPTRAWYLS